MIPETVKDELVKKRLAGATWTELAKFLKDVHGIEVHRTTVMRWWEKEVSIENANPDDVSLDSVEDRIKLDKRLATYKAESNYYKKLYESSLKDTAKNNLFVDTVKKLAPSFDKVSLCKYNKPKGKAKKRAGPLDGARGRKGKKNKIEANDFRLISKALLY